MKIQLLLLLALSSYSTQHGVCKCPTTYRHMLPGCELSSTTLARTTPTNTTSSATTTPTTATATTGLPKIWTALDDCCGGKFFLASALGCAYKVETGVRVCKCPAIYRDRLTRCELPTTTPAPATPPPESWTASDDCCNGNNLMGAQVGCAYTVPPTTAPTTTLPTTTLPTTTLPTTTLPPPTTTPFVCNPGYQPDPNNPRRCIDIDECRGNHPCQQECANRPGSFRCNCDPGFAIDPADRTMCKALRACTDQVDVFFLLDESDNVHPNSYKHVKRFPAKMAHHFFIGPANAKFGAAKVGTNVDDLFGLDTYSKRIDVATALRATTYGGGEPNIHLGLHYVSNNDVFSSASGGRDTAPDVVVVVLGGPSAEPEKAKEAADRVRSRGGQVIAVGAGPNLTRAELRSIASSDKDTFLVPTLDDLDDVEKVVMEQICPSTRT